jgi:hypothetical protein
MKEFYALSPQMPKARELVLIVVLASLAEGEGWGVRGVIFTVSETWMERLAGAA